MARTLGRDRVARPPGVIETLTAGYETINRRLWLLLIPIGLDLLFWVGPKLSIVWLGGYLPLSDVGTEQRSAVADSLAYFNLAFVLALYVPTVLGKPPFAPVGAELSVAGARSVYQVLPPGLLLALALLVPAALLIAACYLGGIGQLVRTEAAAPAVPRGAAWLRSAPRHWWRIVVLHAAAVVAIVLLAVPWTLALLAGVRLSGEAAGLLIVLTQVALLWAAVYFFFALDAVILTDLHPVRAALSSVHLVRDQFWPALGLIGLTLLIGTGLPIVWRALAGQPLGLVASIVGNAYVGTGLAAASMLFYRDR